MTYLDLIAQEIRDAVPSEKLPKNNTDLLFLIYAVLMLAKGEETTRVDIHNAWAAWAISVGKSSSSIVDFADLSAEVQAQDQPFVDAVVAVARRQHAGR